MRHRIGILVSSTEHGYEAHLVSSCVGVPHAAETVSLVHEEVALVLGLLAIHGLAEAPLHVVLPLPFVPSHARRDTTRTQRDRDTERRFANTVSYKSIHADPARKGLHLQGYRTLEEKHETC